MAALFRFGQPNRFHIDKIQIYNYLGLINTKFLARVGSNSYKKCLLQFVVNDKLFLLWVGAQYLSFTPLIKFKSVAFSEGLIVVPIY